MIAITISRHLHKVVVLLLLIFIQISIDRRYTVQEDLHREGDQDHHQGIQEVEVQGEDIIHLEDHVVLIEWTEILTGEDRLEEGREVDLEVIEEISHQGVLLLGNTEADLDPENFAIDLGPRVETDNIVMV